MARRRKARLGGLLRLLLWGLGAVGVLLAIGALALTLLGMPTYEVARVELEVEGTAQQVARGKRLVSMLCRRCHFSTVDGRLAGRELTELSPRLGKIRAPNLTRDPDVGLGQWSAGDLALLLRTGINPKTGQLAVPTMVRLPGASDEDLKAIIAFLQSDDPWVAPHPEEPPPSRYSLQVKARALASWEPLPYPRKPIPGPEPGDIEALGRYLVDDLLQCSGCHSATYGELDVIKPSRTEGYLAGGATTADLNGVALSPANLTPHATGIAGWTGEQFRRALVDGFGPDAKVIRWPMQRYAGLDDREVEAIYAYLQALDPVDNKVEAAPDYRMIGRKADGGRHLYLRYGCQYCHGKQGIGLGDMRRGGLTFTTDQELTAYLKDPSQRDPLAIMPGWEGVIAEDEYPELCAYIRELGKGLEAEIKGGGEPQR